MQLILVLCLVAGAFAVRDCPENSHYNSCGTACPLTCENYLNPPKACVLMCNPGCHCDEGYVKTQDGRCVRPEDCPSRAVNFCLFGPDYGSCSFHGFQHKLYYDAQTGTCKYFIWSGCGGNKNKFDSEEECMKTCGSTKPQAAQSEVCDQPIETGPCRAYFHRYAYDKETGECRKFIYGGCRANTNNFKSLEECQRTCVV